MDHQCSMVHCRQREAFSCNEGSPVVYIVAVLKRILFCYARMEKRQFLSGMCFHCNKSYSILNYISAVHQEKRLFWLETRQSFLLIHSSKIWTLLSVFWPHIFLFPSWNLSCVLIAIPFLRKTVGVFPMKQREGHLSISILFLENYIS